MIKKFNSKLSNLNKISLNELNELEILSQKEFELKSIVSATLFTIIQGILVYFIITMNFFDFNFYNYLLMIVVILLVGGTYLIVSKKFIVDKYNDNKSKILILKDYLVANVKVKGDLKQYLKI